MEWFHSEIALKLEEAIKSVEKGEDVRLMIFMPPRHGKSDTATQKLPSWVLGYHSDWPFIIASYSQELATDFGQGTRDLMDSTNYQSIFDTRLRQDTQAKSKWMTEKGGGYTAVGVGGAITGRGFKVGIIDDPFKNREEADSPVTRESVLKWYRSTFYTRQEGNTAIILILTRWHDADLAGTLLKEEQEAIKAGETDYDKWDVLEYKAIAEKDEPNRKIGEPLWPWKFNIKKLLKTKAALGSYEFYALYQQNPIDEENQEFKRSWIQYKSWEDVSKMNTRKFASIDPAGSKHKKSDNTGVTRNYVNDLNEWYIKSKRYRINSKGIIELIFELHDEGMEVIGIEQGTHADAIEPFFKDECAKRNKYPNVVPLKHGGTMKETRIRGLIPRYESKKIWHINGECADLEEEYLRFPKSAHDDCLDTTAYQNQIAQPPSAGIGDRLTKEEIEKNITSKVNDQSGSIVIGLSTANPAKYVIGNKQGLFFNKSSTYQSDPYTEISGLISTFGKCYVFADQVGDTLGLRTLQTKHSGKVFICWLKTDPKSQTISDVRKGEEFSQVDIAQSATIQILVDEIRGRRLSFYGTTEDWSHLSQQLINLYRTWEEDSMNNKVPNWNCSGPMDMIKALIFFRVGLDKFAENNAEVLGSSMFEGMETAKIFEM